MIALSVKETWEYVLKEERGSEKPTRFTLRPLTMRDRAEVEDLMRGGSLADVPMGAFKMKVLRVGLAGWTGLLDENGTEVRVQFDRAGAIREDLLARLPSAVQAELAWEVFARSAIGDDDRKN